MPFSVCISEARVQKIRKSVSFWKCETSISFVLLRKGEIYLFVSNIHVPKNNYFFLWHEFFHVITESYIIFLGSVGKSGKLVAWVRFVNIYKVEIFILQCDNSSFKRVTGLTGDIFKDK